MNTYDPTISANDRATEHLAAGWRRIEIITTFDVEMTATDEDIQRLADVAAVQIEDPADEDGNHALFQTANVRHHLTVLPRGLSMTSIDGRTPCLGTPCDATDHDHTQEDGLPMTCNDCGVPTHYDSAIEDYRHDDPNAQPCFLIRF